MGYSRIYKSAGYLLLLFVIGGIVGTWLGEAFGNVLPKWAILKQSATIGLPGGDFGSKLS
jgi:hypothetical protein